MTVVCIPIFGISRVLGMSYSGISFSVDGRVGIGTMSVTVGGLILYRISGTKGEEMR